MRATDPTVLVVGAGPAGMTAALLLARLGIPTRIIERRATSQSAPAAHVVNARTFEILRTTGVDMQAIADACKDPADAGRVYWVTTLTGRELGHLPFERQDDGVLALSPTPLRNLSQHRLEPILADTLRHTRGVELTYGHEWLDATQDADGVTSRVRESATGAITEIRSRWLIAADGAASPVRRSLGIEMIGPDRLQSFLMIHCEANFRALVGERPGVLYWTTAPAMGTFVAHDIDTTWVYMHPWDPDRESAADYTESVCADLVRRALGTDAHPFAIRTIRTWTMTAQVAERYREGAMLLVGDAAHRFPPTGGLGLNTGVQDAHNLAWKIAAVERAWAPPSLLDTYEAERRPVAQRNADVSLQNAMRLAEVYRALAARGDDDTITDELRTAIANQAEHFDMLGLQLGYTYGGSAIAAESEDAAVAGSSIREYVPNALPGSRLPHAWVTHDGRRVSTLDLVRYDRFTLIVGAHGEGWTAARSSAAPIDVLTIGRDLIDADGAWTTLLGIEPDGAVLVRPDQHVAWRARRAPAEPAAALAAICDRILDRTAILAA